MTTIRPISESNRKDDPRRTSQYELSKAGITGAPAKKAPPSPAKAPPPAAAKKGAANAPQPAPPAKTAEVASKDKAETRKGSSDGKGKDAKKDKAAPAPKAAANAANAKKKPEEAKEEIDEVCNFQSLKAPTIDT